jgi:hypothetical protein
MVRSFPGSHANRLNDAGISPAPADIALHGAPDFGLGRVRLFMQQTGSGHDHAGSAVSALQGIGFDKGSLQRVQMPIALHAFDGSDLFALRELHRRTARSHGDAVEEDGARTALPFTAAVLGAGEVEFFAKNV